MVVPPTSRLKSSKPRFVDVLLKGSGVSAALPVFILFSCQVHRRVFIFLLQEIKHHSTALAPHPADACVLFGH